MEYLFSPEFIFEFLTLTAMEIVLGIDNIIFISILTAKLPFESQKSARYTGLSMALLLRIALLFTVSWIIHLTFPLFSFNIISHFVEISPKDLILISGGLFLIYKSATEIFHNSEDEENPDSKQKLSFTSAIIQIIILDLVFSIDSIITAVGLVDDINIIIGAVIVSMIIMLIFAKVISDFINKNPSIKLIALAFLIMIGTMLLAEGFKIHFPKGYIYFSMSFALIIELINMKKRNQKKLLKADSQV